MVIEKITAPLERLPESWAVHGTTGYRFANVLNGLFVDGRNEAKITRAYEAFVDDDTPPGEVGYRSRRLILRAALASELTVLANQLSRLARADRGTRDYTLNTPAGGARRSRSRASRSIAPTLPTASVRQTAATSTGQCRSRASAAAAPT